MQATSSSNPQKPGGTENGILEKIEEEAEEMELKRGKQKEYF